ncbi:MAG: iron chelate uptake ABC transporter family permease subunit [Gaiellales bacterium]
MSSTTADLSSASLPTGRTPAGGLTGRRSTRALGLLGCAALLLVLTLSSLAVGSKGIPLGTVVDAYRDYDPTNNDQLIVRELREPRTLLGLAVGLALGLAGTLMQGITRNPLADPGILGINAGAAVGVVIGIYALDLTAPLAYVWFAFAGALGAMTIVYGLGSLGRREATPVKLALAGAALSAVLVSITTAIVLLDQSALEVYRFWVVGSLVSPTGDVVGTLAPLIAVGTVVAVCFGRSLNALALGDDVARALGQRVVRTRMIAALTIALLAGSATAAAGPIAFVGLAVPHIARSLTGPDYRWALPYAALLAPALLLAADVAGRVVARPGELAVGVTTALLGAPFFVLLVRRRKLVEI